MEGSGELSRNDSRKEAPMKRPRTFITLIGSTLAFGLVGCNVPSTNTAAEEQSTVTVTSTQGQPMGKPVMTSEVLDEPTVERGGIKPSPDPSMPAPAEVQAPANAVEIQPHPGNVTYGSVIASIKLPDRNAGCDFNADGTGGCGDADIRLATEGTNTGWSWTGFDDADVAVVGTRTDAPYFMYDTAHIIGEGETARYRNFSCEYGAGVLECTNSDNGVQVRLTEDSVTRF